MIDFEVLQTYSLLGRFLSNLPVPVVSILASKRDFHLPSLSVHRMLKLYPQLLNLKTRSIKDVYRDCDHLSILWCTELIEKLSAVMLQMAAVNDIGVLPQEITSLARTQFSEMHPPADFDGDILASLGSKVFFFSKDLCIEI